MEEKYSFEAMKEATYAELQILLHELKVHCESRIQLSLDRITNPRFVKNKGAIDAVYLNDNMRRESFLKEVDTIVKELKIIGHKLKEVDFDSDKNFDSTCISLASMSKGGWVNGLDLEFLPKRTTVFWAVSPRSPNKSLKSDAASGAA